MMKFIRNIRKNEEGATAIEYGLIAALIAVAAVGVMSSVGDSLTGTFTSVDTRLQAGVGKGA